MNKLSLFIGVLLSTLFISCNREDTHNEIENSKKDLSGETLFKSIMFGAGDFSANLPTLENIHNNYKNATPKQKEEINQKLDILISSIKTQDSNFFIEFKQLVTSNKHLLIKKALEKSANKIAENMEILIPNFNQLQNTIENDIRNKSYITADNQVDPKLLKQKEEEYKKILSNNFISSSDSEMGCSWAVACAAYFALVVHNTVAVTTNVAVAMAAWKWVAVTSDKIVDSDDKMESFQTEILINEIAITY